MFDVHRMLLWTNIEHTNTTWFSYHILPDQRSTVASLVRNKVSAVQGVDVEKSSRESEDPSVENSTDKLSRGGSQRRINVRHHRNDK